MLHHLRLAVHALDVTHCFLNSSSASVNCFSCLFLFRKRKPHNTSWFQTSAMIVWKKMEREKTEKKLQTPPLTDQSRRFTPPQRGKELTVRWAAPNHHPKCHLHENTSQNKQTKIKKTKKIVKSDNQTKTAVCYRRDVAVQTDVPSQKRHTSVRTVKASQHRWLTLGCR